MVVTCTVAIMRAAALTFTRDPTSILVRGPVTAVARRVDTVVIDTERATSPFAISVTRFDAVPPSDGSRAAGDATGRGIRHKGANKIGS